MKAFLVYKGKPVAVLEKCTYDEEKKKLLFEGHEIVTAKAFGSEKEMKDWMRDYIETYRKNEGL